MKKITSIILAFIIAFSDNIIFSGCSLFHFNAGPLEKKYLEDKEYFDEFLAYYYPEEEYEFFFADRSKISDDEYRSIKRIYGIPSFEEVCYAKNDKEAVLIAFKGNEKDFSRYAGDKIINFVKYNDYFLIDHVGFYPFVDEIVYVGDMVYTSDEKTLLSVDYCEIQNNIFSIPSNTTSLGGYLGWKSESHKVICNDELLRIGTLCFSFQHEIQSVYLNEGLEYIASLAFFDCISLKQIVIPKSVKQIGSDAFNCTSVFCEAPSKPEGWHEEFAVETAKVYYADEWHYDKDGNPVVNAQ